MNRDLDDEPWPIPVRQQRQYQSPFWLRWLWLLCERVTPPPKPEHVRLSSASVLDEDGRPLPPRPWEPPGPPPRRRWTWKHPMVIVVVLAVVAFLVLCVLIASDTKFGVGVG